MLDALAKHIDHAALCDFSLEPAQELLPGWTSTRRLRSSTTLGCVVSQERAQLRPINSMGFVVIFGISLDVMRDFGFGWPVVQCCRSGLLLDLPNQALDNERLKPFLRGVCHARFHSEFTYCARRSSLSRRRKLKRCGILPSWRFVAQRPQSQYSTSMSLGNRLKNPSLFTEWPVSQFEISESVGHCADAVAPMKTDSERLEQILPGIDCHITNSFRCRDSRRNIISVCEIRKVAPVGTQAAIP